MPDGWTFPDDLSTENNDKDEATTKHITKQTMKKTTGKQVRPMILLIYLPFTTGIAILDSLRRTCRLSLLELRKC